MDKPEHQQESKPLNQGQKPMHEGDNAKLPPGRTWIWFLGILILNYAIVSMFMPGPDKPVIIPYTLFKTQIEQGNVKAVYTRGETITGRFQDTVTYAPPNVLELENPVQPVEIENFSTILPSFLDPGLERLLLENEVEILAEPIQQEINPFVSFLMRFGPALFFIGLYIWIFRRARKMGGGMGHAMMNMGRSTAKRFDKQGGEKVTFADVAGIDEAKNELAEIVDFLRNP